MKRVTILCILCSLLLTGCQGRILGTDEMEAVAYTPTGSAAYPYLTGDTTVVRLCKEFVENIKAQDFDSAFARIDIPDNTFISLNDFKAVASKWVFPENIEFREAISSGSKYVTVSLSDDNLSIRLIPQEDNSWKLYLDSFIINDFEIFVPRNMKLSLDGKNLDKYKDTDYKGDDTEALDRYVIPAISTSSHKIELSTAFSDKISATISGITQSMNVKDYLVVKDPLRGQVRDAASELLDNINKTVVKRDWEAFKKYLAPGVSDAQFSAAFATGYNAKSAAYDLQLIETRDLQLSDLDVKYTGYDTIEVTFGTRWKFVAAGDWEENDDGEIIVEKYSEMKIKNTLELQYVEGHWLLKDIDNESLSRLTGGLEQWR